MDIYKSRPYVQTFTNFWISCINQEHHERTCGYWYVVTTGAYSHTAFAERNALLEWLTERGLPFNYTLPEERGYVINFYVVGTYSDASHLNLQEFLAIEPILKIAQLDNGDYTLGKVTQDEQGIRTVHYLNPNIRNRVVFPYFETRQREPGMKALIEASSGIQ